MRILAREEFLRGLWSYWLAVGIAWRRVRTGAAAEKTTTLLRQLWNEQGRFSEQEPGSAANGYWPERNTLWVRRSDLRALLHLPTAQFADDDAVNIFYSGQAFYDRTTTLATDRKVRDWRIAGAISISAKLPVELRDLAATLHLDLDDLAFPGWYFNGYDDATIWIGRTEDEQLAARLQLLTPDARALLLQGAPVPPSSTHGMLLESILQATLQVANTPVRHADTLQLLTEAVTNTLLPPKLVPDALAYMLFVQTQAIPDYVAVIVRLIDKRRSVVRDVFAAQAQRDVRVARKALVLLVGALCGYGQVQEAHRVVAQTLSLLDPESILELLKLAPNRPRGTSLFDQLAEMLRSTSTATPWQLNELRYLTRLRNIGVRDGQEPAISDEEA